VQSSTIGSIRESVLSSKLGSILERVFDSVLGACLGACLGAYNEVRLEAWSQSVLYAASCRESSADNCLRIIVGVQVHRTS